MNFFHGKKGHFATKKRALAKTWGAWPPRFLRPWVIHSSLLVAKKRTVQ
jgi:hypothetical protein